MPPSRMSRLWELLAVLVIGGMLLRAAIAFILPLVPYMIGAVVLFAVIGGAYLKRRNW